MKALYTLSIFVCIAFGITIVHFFDESSRMRMLSYSEYRNDFSISGFQKITIIASLVSTGFLIFYILIYGLSIHLINRTTSKVISIIGLSLSVIILAFLFLPLSDPGKISFDEFGPFVFLYALAMLAFCIVNMLQAFRNKGIYVGSDQLIDDVV